MLDVARETYKENVSDIFDLNRTLSEEHNLPLALTYQERGGGFWFTLSKDDLEGELPRGFLNVTARGAKWFFTSMELVSAHDAAQIGPINVVGKCRRNEMHE